MEPYPTDPRFGGQNPPGTPGAPVWSGQNPPGAPAWGPPGAPGAPGAPAWMGPNAGVPQPLGMVPVVDPKWPALRLIATILKIVAWVEGGIGAISALAAGISLSATVLGGAGFLVTLFLLVMVAIGFLLTYAYSEFIMLFITIEKNTRPR